jgi:tetratricopeptide (TPR) repeat protein
MAIVLISRILALSLLFYSGDNAFELYSIGNQLELEGKTTEAIEYYKRALELEPDAIEIHVSLASVLYMTQKFDEGLGYAHEALTIDPDDLKLYQIVALGYIGKRDLPKAIEYYTEMLELDPQRLETYLAIATLREAMNQPQEAIHILERVPADQRTADLYVKLGALAGRVNDHIAAIEYYREGHNRDTTSLTAIIGMGTGFDMLALNDSAIYYYKQAIADTIILNVAQRLLDIFTDTDQYDNVVAMAHEILAIDHGNTHVRRSLGFAHYKLGQPESALDEFTITLRLDPGDTYSAFYVARIYLEQGDYTRALSAVQDALKIDPDFIELWIYLGFVALEQDNYELAEHAFAEAAYRDGDLSQIYYLLGAIAETLEKDRDAYYYYRKSLGVNSRNLSSLQALASLTSRLGRDNETFHTFQRIIEVDTLNAVALNYVGYSYAERRDSLEYALELVNRALAIEVDNGYYIDSRGWIFYMMGRYEDALVELQRASEIVEDAVIFEHLGDVYLKLGEPSKAKDAYEKALEMEPQKKDIKAKLNEIE